MPTKRLRPGEDLLFKKNSIVNSIEVKGPGLVTLVEWKYLGTREGHGGGFQHRFASIEGNAVHSPWTETAKRWFYEDPIDAINAEFEKCSSMRNNMDDRMACLVEMKRQELERQVGAAERVARDEGAERPERSVAH